MADFGVTVDHIPAADTVQESFTVAANATFKGQNDYQIEGDWSNTAIWMVAAAMTGQAITITGMNKNSVQADRRIMQVIESAGCTITWDGMNITVSGRASKPIHADLEQMPDMLPAYCSPRLLYPR